jgi:hypothetical protein
MTLLTGLLDSNRNQSHKHLSSSDWTNLVAARKARNDQSITPIDWYRRGRETLSLLAWLRNAKQKMQRTLRTACRKKTLTTRVDLIAGNWHYISEVKSVLILQVCVYKRDPTGSTPQNTVVLAICCNHLPHIYDRAPPGLDHESQNNALHTTQPHHLPTISYGRLLFRSKKCIVHAS